MILHNTRESAIRREAFHRVLEAWLDDSYEDQVGEADHHAGPAWLWVRHGGEHYYLDAAATRPGVREYIRLVRAAGEEIEWHRSDPDAATRQRVAVGGGRASIDGFEFYHHMPRR
jgi:hypothetical protein